jgi:uncharacterized protein involved in outer membrane biogenesis
MQKKLTTLAIVGGIGVAIFVILNIFLNNLLSEERLKAMLIEPAQKEIDRKITIGSAGISLFSGITINDIRIKEADSDSDFISLKTFRLKYKLWPLLQKNLVITEVLLEEPKVRVVRMDDGEFNFTDIVDNFDNEEDELIPTDDESEIETLPLALTFDKINIKQAIVTLIDKTGVLPTINSEADLLMSVQLGETMADLKYDGTFQLLANGEYHGHKPVLQIKCGINEKTIDFRGSLTLGFDKIDVDGRADNYTSSPEIEFNIGSKSIDLDKLASLNQFTSNDDAEEKPAAPQPPAENGGENPEAQKPAALDISAHGRVNIDKLYTSEVEVREITLNYQVKDNIISLNKLGALVFGGSIIGEVKADIANPEPTFQGKLGSRGIEAAKIMSFLDKPAEFFTGSLDTDLTFRGSGSEWPVISKTLDAEGSFTLVNGGMQNTPMTTALATLLGLQELRDLRFENFSGNLRIEKGNVFLDSGLQSSNIDILAKGTVSLDGRLDMPLTLRLSPEYGQILDEQATFAKYLGDDQGRTTLHLKAKGSVQNPKLTIDTKAAGKQIQKAVERKVIEELGRAITKDQSGKTTGTTEDPVKTMSDRLLKELSGN